MPNIQINIKDKVARADRAIIVCDNSDYTAVFDFDDEWSAYETKTVRFVYGGTYTDVVVTGNECPIPKMQDARSLYVGVYAGDLHTTTSAYISCVPSILCGNGIPADPTPDVYNQIMELLNKDSGVWYPAVDDAGNMSWTRSISETAPQPVNIKGPKGDAGADGIGIPGADGKDGVDGKSAYELAQDNGFVGTMQEWLASLVGADGTNGVDGKDGISPTVSVAAITGGNRVTITDAEGAKTFDVMDGAQGASGADGKDYVLTDADKQEIAEAAAGFVDVPSVQPDWNQNDTTKPDYIKNRPFYTGDPVETVLLQETTATFSVQGDKYKATISADFSLEIGTTYKVSWDGTVYSCVCYELSGTPAIGNQYIFTSTSDTGEPFIAGVNPNNGTLMIITKDTSASHTISISVFTGGIIKIDAKYIPELPYMDKENPTGTGSFSLNRKADTTVGKFSFAEGKDTTASGNYSHAEGRNTTASGSDSHAEGRNTTASGSDSHAEGVGTTASGDYSHAEGFQTRASGNHSHAEGHQTKASSLYQHVQGKYNVEDSSHTYADIIGNGTSDSERSNAATVDWSGNAWYAGTVEGKALILPSSTANSTKKFRITVDDSGTITATEVT